MLSTRRSDVGLTCTGGAVLAMKQSCLIGAVILVVAGEGMFCRSQPISVHRHMS